MADFDPRQLDQLEDALEGLEHLDDLESLELSPALTERLAEYQDVLGLCREAFPVEEPRAELLVGVLAEAHAVTRRQSSDGSRWHRFWARWRDTLIPGVTLAGTAAVVLLWLMPDRQLGRSTELLGENQLADETREMIDETDSTPSEPTMPRADDRKLDEPDANPELSDAVPSEPIGTPGSAATGDRKAKSRVSKGAPAIEPEPAPAVTPLDKDETWTTLERANADRRKGDCDRARSFYEEVIAASSDNLAIARAQAGIGLCLEQDRRNTEADQWFEQARTKSAGIDSWIENQRDEQPLPGETKKSKSKAIQMSADDDANSL
jgi:tetratricopeptide (TPR) repeat protein